MKVVSDGGVDESQKTGETSAVRINAVSVLMQSRPNQLVPLSEIADLPEFKGEPLGVVHQACFDAGYTQVIP